MAHILLLNGPNLNLLGRREPAVYGPVTLEQIHERAAKLAAEFGHKLTALQSKYSLWTRTPEKSAPMPSSI